MKEYKIAKGWLVFIYVFAVALYGISCFLLLFPFLQHDRSSYHHLLWTVPVAILLVAFSTFGIRDALKGRLIIDHDGITLIMLMGTRKLLYDDIAGYRNGEKGVVIVEPNIKALKKIKIHGYYGKHDELLQWIRTSFSDLDKVEEAMGHTQILQSDEYGTTAEERSAKLKKAENTAQVANLLGIAIGIWGFAYPYPYLLAVACSAIYPVLCILLLIPFNGLIKLEHRKNAAYPSVIWGFCSSGCALILRGLMGYNIYSHRSNLWKYAVPVIIFVLLLMLLVCKIRQMDKKAAGSWIFLLLFVIAYGYNMMVIANCYFDESTPVLYGPVVTNKRINSGKNKTYYLTLTLWADQKEPDEVSVGKRFYESVAAGDTVKVYYFTGRLNAPWYFIPQ